MEEKPKVVGIVPSRLGSVRVKAKSLRIIGNKPLLYYVINSMKKCKIFDEIYVNSDSPLIGKVAERYGVGFYLRKKALASSDSMIDEYIYDFLKNVDCDILSVVNPTSPFLTSKEIEACVQNFIDSNFAKVTDSH